MEKTVLIRSRAFSLWEVLVAMSVGSFVLLGLIALQVRAGRINAEAYYQSIATVQAESFLQQLKANTTSWAREREYHTWNRWNQQLLPQGHGSYECTSFRRQCTANLSWWVDGRQVFALSGHV